MEDTISLILARIYPSLYPRLNQIFGTSRPTRPEIIQWRASWIYSTNNYLYVDADKDSISFNCRDLKIHPYFWHYINYSSLKHTDIINPKVMFYFDEDFYLYKLTHV